MRAGGFRLKRIDILIGVVIIVAAVLSAVGAASYTDTRGGATFLVTWATDEVDLEAVRASQAGAGDVALPVVVNLTNLTQLDLSVSIGTGAPRLQPTSVLIEVTPPGSNETLTEEATLPAGPATSVAVPFSIPLGVTPNATSVRAASSEAALAALVQDAGPGNGTGEWLVTVRFAPSAPGPLANDAYGIEVAGTATRYEASVQPEVPEVAR